MGNFIYHNKWHRFNHHTVPTPGFPDSGIDPIASRDFPFLGGFYSLIPIETYTTEEPLVTYYPSDSYEWQYYSSLTQTFSSDWELFLPVFLNVTTNLETYSGSGIVSTIWSNLSSIPATSLLTVASLSAETEWTRVTERSPLPVSGYGWHIALSGITWKTNIPQINLKQKNAVPKQLFENENLNVLWDVSTAQTAFMVLTGNFPLTAADIFNAKKGGEYCFWVYIDYCPGDNANLVFDPRFYKIRVKKPTIFNPGILEEIRDTDGSNSYEGFNNVVRLSPNSITKFNFVFDGSKMIGRATQYNTFITTTKDTYYQGFGVSLISSPAYVDNFESFVLPGRGIIIGTISNSFINSVSSLYVPGSGIDISFFGAGTQFINLQLNNAIWLTEETYTKYNALTSSFDRVIGNLPGGAYTDPRYAYNLFASPQFNLAPLTIRAVFPTPPYRLLRNTLTQVPQCLSSVRLDIKTARDRDIKRVIVDNFVRSARTPRNEFGYSQRYNFFNEAQGFLEFPKIQANQPLL